MYNIMTCGGFTTEVLGGCSIAWFSLGIIIFIVLILRKQLNDNFGIDYNLIGGFVGAIVPFLIVVSISGSAKWSLVVGLIGAVIGGVVGGLFLGGGGGDSGEWF